MNDEVQRQETLDFFISSKRVAVQVYLNKVVISPIKNNPIAV